MHISALHTLQRLSNILHHCLVYTHVCVGGSTAVINFQTTPQQCNRSKPFAGMQLVFGFESSSSQALQQPATSDYFYSRRTLTSGIGGALL